MNYDIERLGSGIGESLFFTDSVEFVAKHFPIDGGVQVRQKAIDLIDFIEMVVECEKGELSVHEKTKKGGKEWNACILETFFALSRTPPLSANKERIFRDVLQERGR